MSFFGAGYAGSPGRLGSRNGRVARRSGAGSDRTLLGSGSPAAAARWAADPLACCRNRMPLDRRRLIGSGLVALAAGSAQAGPAPAPSATPPAGREPPTSRPAGTLELAMAANAPSTPTGLAIARGGRIFVMMPRFTGSEPVTLGEVLPDGSVKPYPDARANTPDPKDPQATLFHVPNGVFDRNDTFWILDSACRRARASRCRGRQASGNRHHAGPGPPGDPLDAGVVAESSLNDLRSTSGPTGRSPTSPTRARAARGRSWRSTSPADG